MKAQVLIDKQKFEIWDLPIPQIGNKEVLVRLKACAICNATDSKLYKGSHALVKYPSVIGHEAAGIVEVVGKGVTKVKIGDKVMGASFPGNSQVESIWGQYCEYGIANEDNLVQVPENVNIEDATLAVMLSEALNAIKVGDIKQGDNIIILGAGAVGFSLLTMLKHSCPAQIIVLDINEAKFSTALKLGADFVFNSKDEMLLDKINEVTKGKGINKLFEAVGCQETYNLAIDIINKDGIIIPFGIVEGIIEIPFRKLYAKQGQIRWCKGGGNNPNEGVALVLGMMKKGLIEPDSLVTSRVPLADVTEGFKKIATGNEIRVVLQI